MNSKQTRTDSANLPAYIQTVRDSKESFEKQPSPYFRAKHSSSHRILRNEEGELSRNQNPDIILSRKGSILSSQSGLQSFACSVCGTKNFKMDFIQPVNDNDKVVDLPVKKGRCKCKQHEHKEYIASTIIQGSLAGSELSLTKQLYD